MSITRYGPYTVANAQYTLVKNWRGSWDLTDITGTTLATFTCTRYVGPSGPFYPYACNGVRLANDPQGAVNTWLAQQKASAA